MTEFVSYEMTVVITASCTYRGSAMQSGDTISFKDEYDLDLLMHHLVKLQELGAAGEVTLTKTVTTTEKVELDPACVLASLPVRSEGHETHKRRRRHWWVGSND
jgi:hypothetical protein